jgi:hypothetical protein
MFSLGLGGQTIEGARIMRRMHAAGKVAGRDVLSVPTSPRCGSKAKPLWHIGNAGRLSRSRGPVSTLKCLHGDPAFARIAVGPIDHARAAGDA